MNQLLRALAPITDKGWAVLDQEATERLLPGLGARRLVDFSGPYGWDHSATNLGRTTPPVDGLADGVVVASRRVLPLIELRVPFLVERAELADIDRGAADIDLGELDDAARRISLAENRAVFVGFEPTGIEGIVGASPHPPVPLGGKCTAYPGQVAKAAETLRAAGIAGPYGIALSQAAYTEVVETTEHGGYPLFEHLSHILGGPIVRVPGVDGAAVLSLRGGDFVLESGQDISIGYLEHDELNVHLYLEESFNFRVLTPEAAVALPATPPAAS